MLLGTLLTLLIIDCVALTGVILLQRSEGGALGMGGGGGNFMSARGTGDLLTRTTQILAAIFFILSLSITVLAGRTSGGASVVDTIDMKRLDPSSLAAPAPTAPAPGAAPASPPPGFAAPTPQATDRPLTGDLLAPAPAAPPAGGLALPPAPR